MIRIFNISEDVNTMSIKTKEGAMISRINRSVLTFFILLSLLFFSSCNPLSNEQEELIRELDESLIPLEYSSPYALNDNQLSFLETVKDAKIVGVGEATHGTRDFFQMKHRIFRYMVENCGHKAFGFEADFAESIYLDRYVLHGEGDLEELMKTKMIFWVWKTREVLMLLEWMRYYNSSRPDEEKIHYVGFDCQFCIHHPVLLREYLEDTHPRLWADISPIINEVKDITQDEFNEMEESVYYDILAQLGLAIERIEAEKDLLTARLSSMEYAVVKQLVNTVKQMVTYRYLKNRFVGGSNYTYRDRYMAQNALWIADLFGPDTKITIWAHNAHVAKDPDFYGGSLGHNLHKSLNHRYRSIGFSFCRGRFRARGWDENRNKTEPIVHEITSEPRKDSTNFLLHHASHPIFAFHLAAIPADSRWAEWFAEPRPMLDIGSFFTGHAGDFYYSLRTGDFFDWLIHIEETEASELL
jgi:erythromycin esterase